MAIDNIPTSFRVLHDGGVRGTADMEGSGESLSYIGPWAELDGFLNEIAGEATIVTGGNTASGGVAYLTIPKQHPYNPRWYARSVSWEGLGASSESGEYIAYTLAKVQVEYRNWPFPFDPNSAWFSATLDVGADMITIPGFDLFFASGARIYQNMGRQVGKATLRVTRYRVQDVNYANGLMLSLVNRVNATAFTLYGLAIGTVRFGGGRTEFAATISGKAVQTAEMLFEFSELPWGSLWNPVSHAFELARSGSAAGPLIYTRADINQLISDPNF